MLEIQKLKKNMPPDKHLFEVLTNLDTVEIDSSEKSNELNFFNSDKTPFSMDSITSRINVFRSFPHHRLFSKYAIFTTNSEIGLKTLILHIPRWYKKTNALINYIYQNYEKGEHINTIQLKRAINLKLLK